MKLSFVVNFYIGINKKNVLTRASGSRFEDSSVSKAQRQLHTHAFLIQSRSKQLDTVRLFMRHTAALF